MHQKIRYWKRLKCWPLYSHEQKQSQTHISGIYTLRRLQGALDDFKARLAF